MAQAQNGQYDVFISYAWADGKDYAVHLQAELEKADFRVWRDPNIRKSADFTAEIEIAMRASKLVVVVMTQRIQDKAENYVRREVAYAEILKKPVLVARFDDAIILPLTTRTWFEFWNTSWEIEFPRLVDAIHDEIKLVDAGTYQAPPLPAELQNDPYRKYAQESYELAVSYIEQTTIFKQEIDLIARPDLERVGKTMPRNSALQQAFKRMKLKLDVELPAKDDLTSLAQAMSEYEGRVLLLGEPGAGKTTSLMALTRDLASARMGNPDEPLPIFAFCSGWTASPPQPIHEWLAEANDIPTDEMKRMIEAHEVILVLDGLDELGSSQTEKDEQGQEKTFDPRKRFIEVIPVEGKMVVSTRIEDYEAIGDKITALNGAITLQNLTDKQLQDYLADLPALWDVLKADKDLLEIARTPLLLSLIAYGFRDAPESAQALKDLSSSELRNKIFQTYIDKRYEHERQHLEVMGQEPPFTLEEIYEVLGHVAMINASGGRRTGDLSKTFGIIRDNMLMERDFREKIKDVIPFIEYGIHLNLLAKVDNELRFIHLRMRDMLVNHYCIWERVLDEKLYPTTYAPNPIKALGHLPHNNDQGLKFCVKLLNSTTVTHMRQSAVSVLGEVGSAQAINTLISILKQDNDLSVCYLVAQVLGEIGGKQALDALIYVLQNDENENMRMSAASALGQIGDEQALDVLIESLQLDDSIEVKRSIIKAIGQTGSEQALSVLIDMLKLGDSIEVRCSIARTLGKIGSEQALSALIDTLQHDRHPSLVESVAKALRQIGGERELNVLIDALQHHNSVNTRYSIAKVLKEVDNSNVLNAVIYALHHDNSFEVRKLIAGTYRYIYDEETLNALIYTLYHDKNYKVRIQALSTLRYADSEKTLNVLLYLLEQDTETDVRHLAADALGRIRDKQAIPTLIYALEHDTQAKVRCSVIEALGKSRDTQALVAVTQALKQDKDLSVRELALDILAYIGDERSLSTLIAILQNDKYSELHLFVAWHMLRLGYEKGLIAILQLSYKLKNSDGDYLKPQAAEKLEEIGTPTALEAVHKWRESQEK